MADSHSSSSLFRAYMTVAVLLAICTVASFVVNVLVRGTSLTAMTGFLIILGVAVVKALLVALVFMHLSWDWRSLYFVLVPTGILAATLMVALLPDGVIDFVQDADEVAVSELPAKPGR